MIGLIQRVSKASVMVNSEVIGTIGQGLVVLLGIEKPDTVQHAKRLADKIINYRVFGDNAAKMNLSLQQTQGELLVISQFTLAANTTKGLRPSFSYSAPPSQAENLYQYFIDYCCEQGIRTATGQFAADMQVSLINDGPVTFWLNV